jgi:hypothetical protein
VAAPLQSSMPQFTQLGYNTSVFLEALDPTTGDPVDGVTVTNVDIWADVGDDGSTGTQAGPFMLVPGPNG